MPEADSPKSTATSAAESPLLSVVIPVFNGEAELPDQLDALVAQDFAGPWELIIADNGSTDRTADVAMSYADRLNLCVVDASGHPSQAFALNCGIGAAGAGKLVLLDADDRVDQDYLRAMSAALDDSDFVAARLDCESLNPGWIARSRPSAQVDGLGDPFGLLPVAVGCAIGVRAQVIEEVGGFDIDLPVCQDIDFSWRVQLAGHSLEFVPAALLRYRYRDSLRGIFKQARGYGYSGPMLYKKYKAMGMPRRSPRTAVRFWLGPIRAGLRIRDKGDLAFWLFLVGYRVGLAKGSITERVAYF